MSSTGYPLDVATKQYSDFVFRALRRELQGMTRIDIRSR